MSSTKMNLDEIEVSAPLDSIRIAPQVERAFEAGDAGLEYLVFGPHRKGDGSLNHDSGFWS